MSLRFLHGLRRKIKLRVDISSETPAFVAPPPTVSQETQAPSTHCREELKCHSTGERALPFNGFPSACCDCGIQTIACLPTRASSIMRNTQRRLSCAPRSTTECHVSQITATASDSVTYRKGGPNCSRTTYDARLIARYGTLAGKTVFSLTSAASLLDTMSSDS